MHKLESFLWVLFLAYMLVRLVILYTTSKLEEKHSESVSVLESSHALNMRTKIRDIAERNIRVHSNLVNGFIQDPPGASAFLMVKLDCADSYLDDKRQDHPVYVYHDGMESDSESHFDFPNKSKYVGRSSELPVYRVTIPDIVSRIFFRVSDVATLNESGLQVTVHESPKYYSEYYSNGDSATRRYVQVCSLLENIREGHTRSVNIISYI